MVCALPQRSVRSTPDARIKEKAIESERERERILLLFGNDKEETKLFFPFKKKHIVKSNVFQWGANGPAHAAVPRGGETQSGVQRSGRATRERVLREVRDVAEREIDELRSDVFEQLRAEIHGKRTSDPEQDATRIINTRGRRRRRRRRIRGVYASREREKEKRYRRRSRKRSARFCTGTARKKRVVLQHRGLLRFERSSKREHRARGCR